MSEEFFYTLFLWISFMLAGVVFVALFFVNAPYGRHQRKGWGKMIPSRVGWFWMESPAVFLFAFLFFVGKAPKNIILYIFFFLWEAHYIHRTFVFPLRIVDGENKMPVSVVLMAFVFNLGNTYLNARYLFTLSGGYDIGWLVNPRFILGVTVFWAGYAINRWADRVLILIRRTSHTRYQIPYGGLYRWISCPNYLGEIIEWTGWALATWSLAGLSFAVWTVANLAPRAYANHRWYQQHFREYPKDRKALIPGIW